MRTLSSCIFQMRTVKISPALAPDLVLLGELNVSVMLTALGVISAVSQDHREELQWMSVQECPILDMDRHVLALCAEFI